MNISKWTQVLLGAGLITLPALAQAQEPETLKTALATTTLSGYIDTTAIWKPGTGNANMPGRVYDGSDTQDGFNLNVVSVTLDKPLGEDEWAAGFHVQMLMGPGAYKRGTGPAIPVAGQLASSFTEFAFNEAYINLRVPIGTGLELHVGQFGTFNGYEAYDTYKNPNHSRSFGFFNETSAHTGIAAFYKFNDCISAQVGVGNVGPFNSQVDARSNVESAKAYLAMVSLTAPESFGFLKGATLSAGYTTGPNLANGAHVDQIYVGGNLPLPVSGLTLGWAYDYTGDIFGAFGGSGGYANATALYILWQATEKLKINTRLDYTSASAGWYYGQTTAGTVHSGGDQLGSVTVTLDYALWKNVISRVECRWDHSLDGTSPFGGTAPGAPRDPDAVSLGLNLIYMF